MPKALHLVECPRDAMQGWPHHIPAEKKAAYINTLLQAGFDTIDFGSFVSPKAIPQMADTKEVLGMLDLTATRSALLAIIANLRGAEDAVSYDSVRYLGFPFSVSPTFQLRNTNSTMEHSLKTVEQVQALCAGRGKELVVYLSMGFGNPYGDTWSPETVFEWADRLAGMGIKILSLADTVGLAEPGQVKEITSYLVDALPSVTIGVHLHASPLNWYEKLDAAYTAGCRRYDSAIGGIGGCPMAGDTLVGNLDTVNLLAFLQQKGEETYIDSNAFSECKKMANDIFR